MSGSTVGSTTATYGYDHAGSRVSKTTGGVSTLYPSRFFEQTGSSTSKNIYLGDELIATVYGTGTSTASTTFVHGDHLGSTRFVTDQNGGTEQSITYAAFGTQDSNMFNQYSQGRGYIGEQQDAETNLSYLNARYYDGGRGQFIGQDPVFWEIGQSPDGSSVLSNPQLHNSYSYAGNNPIAYKDPSGRYLESGFDVAMLALSIATFANNPSWGTAAAVALDTGSLAIPGVPAVGGAAIRAGTAVDNVTDIKGSIDAGRRAQAELGFPDVKFGSAGGETAGKKFSDTTRAQAYAESKGKCVFCGSQTTKTPGPLKSNADHSIPRVQGGNATPANAQNTCRTCNLQKGAQTSAQFIEQIRSGIKNLRSK